MEIYDYLEDKGIKVVKLISQDLGRDDRQLFLTTRDQHFVSHKNQIPVTYPNVPYEEHKNVKRRRSQVSSSKEEGRYSRQHKKEKHSSKRSKKVNNYQI